jgi:hypothetical protein
MIKKVLLTSVFLTLPLMANAEILYRVEQITMPAPESVSTNDDMALARKHRFYIGGAYNFAIWSDYTDEHNIDINGKNTSSFDIVAGMRVYDTFRIEANYVNNRAQWNNLNLDSHSAFINAIFDARIDSIYRIFHTQMLVPYVGFGAGISWNSSEYDIKNKTTPALGALAGIGVEFNDIFALDFGYRYMYIFDPKFDTISDFNPTAHQFRAGARIHF